MSLQQIVQQCRNGYRYFLEETYEQVCKKIVANSQDIISQDDKYEEAV